LWYPFSRSLPRHNHPLQPRFGIIAARAIVENGDPETAPPIAPLAPEPELQIEDERIRRQVIASLQQPWRKLHDALARTAHHDHLMRSQVAEPQPILGCKHQWPPEKAKKAGDQLTIR
jgi:hypothetical protein